MSDSKEVTQFFGGQVPVATSALAKSLAALNAASKNRTGSLYLKFTKQGEWLYGPENIEITEDERVLVNPHSLTIGVIGWDNTRMVGEFMYPITSGQRPDYDALEPIHSTKQGDGWKDQLGLQMALLEDGTNLQFTTSSIGGKNVIATLAGDISTHLETAPETPAPVVLLKGSWYKHKEYGKIFTPVIEIVDWYTLDGTPLTSAAKPARKKLV